MKNKKIILFSCFIILLIISIVIGIHIFTNKSKSVEDLTKEFFESYITLDKSIIDKIDYNFGVGLTEEQKKRYESIIKKQYSNLKYNISDIYEEGHLTFVDVEISVYDFKSLIDRADSYIDVYKDKFLVNGKLDIAKTIDYKLDSLENAKDRINYSIKLTFYNKYGKYEMDEVSQLDLDKIKGIY